MTWRRHKNHGMCSTLVDVHPLELRFPWDPNNRSKCTSKCTVTITNWTDHHVGINIITPKRIADDIIPFFSRSWVDIPFQRMEPHSTLTFDISMGMHHQRPQKSKLEVLMVLMETDERLETFLQSLGGGRLDKEGKDIQKRVKSFQGQVRREVLTAVTYDPVSCQQQTVKEVDQKILPALEFGCVRCMDVHPTKTWVLLGHGGGLASIWNYQTENMVMVMQVTEAHEYGPSGYCSTKFIAREQWFASGHIGGWVHVCAYSTRDTVKKFQAHSDGFVTSLAVHPTMSFLLTSSTANHTPIKLWNWGQDWTCTREFLWHSGGVYNLTFHPTEANSFASFSTFDRKRECAIWDIRLSDPIVALDEDSVNFSPVGPCCFYTDDDTGQQFLLTSTKRGSRSYIMIWDSRKEVVHHLLAVPGGCVLDVACHPTLPILASVTVDWDAMTQVYVSQMCLWDARTYRLEKAVQLKECPVGSMVFTGTEELARLFVPVPKGILMTEIILPTLKRDQLKGKYNGLDGSCLFGTNRQLEQTTCTMSCLFGCLQAN